MRTTDALVVIAVLAAPARARADARPPLVAGLGVEASVVGESYGVRPELLWRLGGASHLRVAAGVLPGPELTFVPISVGYRASWRADRTVQPLVGAGWETQHFVLDGAPTVHRWLVGYLEGGCGFAVAPGLSLGLAVSLDWSFLEEPGPGLQLRGFASYRF